MIEPGVGSSKFKIGMSFDEVDLTPFEVKEIEDRDIFSVYKTEFIWFFFLKKNKRLDQLSFFSPFDEKVLDKVGIGDTLDDVKQNFGKGVFNHKVFEPLDYPGVAFEMASGSKSNGAIIEIISVSDPYAYYGPV